jgi:RNA polymerase subunit RPABC4/transcription elongation factor Spt4
MMSEGEQRDIFLSCFKCGRIVRANDSECPRCGLQFGPGTLFECPFCSGLVWRNAVKCSTCGIDLTEFSDSVEKSSSGFDMDEFVDNIIDTELEQIKSQVRRVACPGCGLMIRGDEDRCPRCDLPLTEAKVDCPVCGDKIPIAAKSCRSCQAVFEEIEEITREEDAELAEDALGATQGGEDAPRARKGTGKKAPVKKKAQVKRRAVAKKARPRKGK